MRSPKGQEDPELLEVPMLQDDLRELHRIFRFPAKFHPPVVDALLTRYTQAGDLVLDPFCGSGTVLLEAQRLGRASVGFDIDPLAVFVSRTKSRRYDMEAVTNALREVLAKYESITRGSDEYERLMRVDLDDRTYAEESASVELPDIPRLGHWFRRYVAIDLARMLEVIRGLEVDDCTRDFLLLIFASIIRNCSNADPVPVSGLEVTSHMKRRDEAGRLVDPFALFRRASGRGIEAIARWMSTVSWDLGEPLIEAADATNFTVSQMPDAVLTSPPYHNAVDYYRRHQLEMYWLGLTVSHADRLQLRPGYIGRAQVPGSHPALAMEFPASALASKWLDDMEAADVQRARDFRAYVSSMSHVFQRIGVATRVDSPILFVVGRSTWNGNLIPTDELFVELAEPVLSLEKVLQYPVKNRYMSYSRHNGASIDREYVLVFRRTDSPVAGDLSSEAGEFA